MSAHFFSTLIFSTLNSILDTLSTDGKTKSIWLKNPHGSCACWICQAYGLQLAQKKYVPGKNGMKKNPIFKVKDRRSLRCGFGNCHTRNRGLDNLAKFAWHKDFKKATCVKYVIMIFND